MSSWCNTYDMPIGQTGRLTMDRKQHTSFFNFKIQTPDVEHESSIEVTFISLLVSCHIRNNAVLAFAVVSLLLICKFAYQSVSTNYKIPSDLEIVRLLAYVA